MANVLAQLKVLLSADTSQLSSGLNEAELKTGRSAKNIERQFHGLGSTFARLLGPLSETGRQVSVAIDAIGESAAESSKALSGMGSALSMAAGVGVGALVALTGVTLKLFEAIDKIDDAAKGVGMGVSEYTQLTNVLKIYGIEQEQANQALAYFDKILSGLVRSKAGMEGIKALGLDIQKLRQMNPHEALLTVADAFSKVKDGTMKAGVAAALFENTYGIKLIPVLNQGREGILEMESKFKDLGDETEKAADATKNLEISWRQFTAGLASGALKIASAARIPGMLLAIAHPLLTLQAMFDDWGWAFVGVLRRITETVKLLYDTINKGAGVLGLPKISTTGLASNISTLKGFENALASERDQLIKQINTSGERSAGGAALNVKMPGGGNADKVTAYLAGLRQELVRLGQGDTAAGLARLKELGATQKQIAEGRGLLDAIQALKDEQKFVQEFEHTQSSMAKLLDRLKIPQQTVDQAKKLAVAFGDVTFALREAGAAALGLERDTGMAGLKAQASQIGMPGAPIGGAVPVFTPSGFGKMRFNMEKLGESAKSLGRTMTESFQRMVEGGLSFRQMLSGMVKQFEIFIIKTLIFKQIASALSGSTGFLGVIGKFFGGLAGPGRALGGPVNAGGLYKVGETGPEWFAPGVSGTVIPMGKEASGGRPLTYAPVFNINTPNADSFRRSQGQLLADGYRQMAAMHSRNG